LRPCWRKSNSKPASHPARLIVVASFFASMLKTSTTSRRLSPDFTSSGSRQSAPQTSTTDRKWYRRDDVGELSREEAAVIARRAVRAFARGHDLPVDQADTLADLVAITLHRCFVTNVVNASSPLGTLHGECGPAVEAATRAQLGAARACELGKAIEADLAAGRSSRPG
jgi:hypothetical protein